MFCCSTTPNSSDGGIPRITSLPVRFEKALFCMNDQEHAEELLEAALRDRRALGGMTNVETFSEEIFGFHAQQAVEKALPC